MVPIVAAAAALLLAAAGALARTAGAAEHGGDLGYFVVDLVTGAAYLTAAAVLLRRGRRGTPTRVFVAIGVAAAVSAATGQYALLWLDGIALPGGVWALWAQSWLYLPALALAAVVLPVVLAGGDRRRLLGGVGAVALVHVAVLAVQPHPLLRSGGQPNPLGVPGADAWLPVTMLASALLLPIGPVLLWRHRRRTVAASWYLSGAVLLMTALLVDVAGVAGISPYGEALSWSLHLATLPLLPGVVLAVELRREPLRRLLVWTLLPLGLVWSYLSVVGWLAAVLRVRAGAGITLLAAVAVAVAFEPARTRLERAADRLVYGDRRDPLAVLNQIAAQLPPPGGAGTLDRVAAEVVARLRLAGFTVELARVGGWEPTAHAGTVTAGPVEFPLVDHGEIVGRALAHCRPGDRLTAADRDLLGQICRQLSTAVVAHRAAVDLRRSRARLVSARAEERHRLGRDLHDDLGPALAGIALGLRAAANRVTAGSPAGVADLLDALGRQSALAAEQVRRLAHELHPPWPDGDGDLVAALRTRIAEVVEAGGPQTTLTAPDDLPDLPVAVRSAAYRVTAEALTNVLRHAHAGTCRVTVSVRDGLVVEVVDDGVGLPEHRRPGIGLTAMRDRAAELDGTLQVGAADPGGTAVRLTLPLPA